nr:energy-coupling factor transporter ATPase [Caloramator sp. ALD01]
MQIKIQNLNYYYPNSNEKALDNINLEIKDGEFILVAGYSGSGKSTLAKCITGAIPNFYGGKIGGKVLLDDEEILKIDERRRASLITMVFQDPERQLLMNKVYREIAFGLENIALDEGTIKKRIWESLEFCGITDLYDRDISTLSGGQKQKVAIASALSFMPRCIILDEPTSQLDPVSADEILNIVKKINRELMINVIVIEQRVSRWFDGIDKLIVMKDGRLEFVGTKEEAYRINNSEVNQFLPSRIKVAKKIGIEQYPSDSRVIKSRLKDISLKSINKGEKKGEDRLKVEGITVKYGSFTAVKNVGFSIKSGEIAALIGPNGAGKSTLLKSIIGLVDYRGNILLDGKTMNKLSVKDRAQQIGYLSQNPNDYITKDTVYEELLFTLNNFNIKDKGIVDDILKKLDLYKHKDKNPRDLSGGEKQRLALANTLILRPKVLLLDEPTRGIDNNIKGEIAKILKSLADEGVSIILITHDIEFAAEVCDKFILMFNGEIAEMGDRKILEDCIFYTTETNKLIREFKEGIFTYKQFIEALEGNK